MAASPSRFVTRRGEFQALGTRTAASPRMAAKRKDRTGISNRSPQEEAARQARVEARKGNLPDFETVNRARKDHPMDKDRESDIASRDRVSETGAGRGLDHIGH